MYYNYCCVSISILYNEPVTRNDLKGFSTELFGITFELKGRSFSTARIFERRRSEQNKMGQKQKVSSCEIRVRNLINYKGES